MFIKWKNLPSVKNWRNICVKNKTLYSILMQQVAALFGKTATIKNVSLLCDGNDITFKAHSLLNTSIPLQNHRQWGKMAACGLNSAGVLLGLYPECPSMFSSKGRFSGEVTRTYSMWQATTEWNDVCHAINNFLLCHHESSHVQYVNIQNWINCKM